MSWLAPIAVLAAFCVGCIPWYWLIAQVPYRWSMRAYLGGFLLPVSTGAATLLVLYAAGMR